MYILKYTLSLTMSVFFKKAVDLTIYFFNKNVGSLFFVKLSAQNQFAGGFP